MCLSLNTASWLRTCISACTENKAKPHTKYKHLAFKNPSHVIRIYTWYFCISFLWRSCNFSISILCCTSTCSRYLVSEVSCSIVRFCSSFCKKDKTRRLAKHLPTQTSFNKAIQKAHILTQKYKAGTHLGALQDSRHLGPQGGLSLHRLSQCGGLVTLRTFSFLHQPRYASFLLTCELLVNDENISRTR